MFFSSCVIIDTFFRSKFDCCLFGVSMLGGIADCNNITAMACKTSHTNFAWVIGKVMENSTYGQLKSKLSRGISFLRYNGSPVQLRNSSNCHVRVSQYCRSGLTMWLSFSLVVAIKHYFTT